MATFFKVYTNGRKIDPDTKDNLRLIARQNGVEYEKLTVVTDTTSEVSAESGADFLIQLPDTDQFQARWKTLLAKVSAAFPHAFVEMIVREKNATVGAFQGTVYD